MADPDRRTVIVIGVTSAIARAVAADYARDGFDLVVTARDPEELEAVAADLALRFRVKVRPRQCDALDYASHETLFADVPDLTGVVLALGLVGDQEEGETDFGAARRILDTNYTGCVSLLERAAEALERQGGGFICAIGSVAGDRGRRSNYLYGSAKAGLAAYLQGLRARGFKRGVSVTTVKPGYVDTRMTYGKPGLVLVASPERAARGIRRAVRVRRSVVYVPWFWRPIMWVVRAIPEPLFKRLNL